MNRIAGIVFVGDFKLVITWSGPWQVAKRELFNLAKDTGEQQNLAETMPEKANELSATLNERTIAHEIAEETSCRAVDSSR